MTRIIVTGSHQTRPLYKYFNILDFRYWNEPYFEALKIIQKAADAAGLTMTEIALRWVSHHSLLKREHGDAVIIGASSLSHIKEVRYGICGRFETINPYLLTEFN